MTRRNKPRRDDATFFLGFAASAFALAFTALNIELGARHDARFAEPQPVKLYVARSATNADDWVGILSDKAAQGFVWDTARKEYVRASQVAMRGRE
jgi:hypothetical protein